MNSSNYGRGYHGVGRHDSGGKMGSYSKFSNQRNFDFKKFGAIAGGIFVLLLIIMWISSRSSNTVNPTEVGLRNIVTEQSKIITFINEYERDLSSYSAANLAAQAEALTLNNQTKLTKYYQTSFSSKTSLTVKNVDQKTQERMTSARQTRRYDDEFRDIIQELATSNNTKINTLHTQSTSLTKLRELLKQAYENNESVIKFTSK